MSPTISSVTVGLRKRRQEQTSILHLVYKIIQWNGIIKGQLAWAVYRKMKNGQQLELPKDLDRMVFTPTLGNKSRAPGSNPAMLIGLMGKKKVNTTVTKEKGDLTLARRSSWQATWYMTGETR